MFDYNDDTIIINDCHYSENLGKKTSINSGTAKEGKYSQKIMSKDDVADFQMH